MKTHYSIRNLDIGCNVSTDAELARNWWRRMRGLLGTARLAAGQALILQPCPSIHTWGMRYAIDVAFIDRNYRIIKMIHSIQPWRMSPIMWQAIAAIEVPAGTLRQTGTLEGHRLAWRAQEKPLF